MTSKHGERFLEGRHAIVTGGGRGIGAAVADALARAGAHITLMGRTASLLEAGAAQLAHEHGVRTSTSTVDVMDEAGVARAFAAARDALGDAYILINNAGQAEGAAFVETSRELWDRMLAVNLTSAFLCARQVAPAMIEAGEGRIVNIASTAGLKGVARVAAYCAAKHGLIGLTRSMAVEFAKLGITVNAVCPGYTDTEMTERTVQAIAARTGKPPEEALRLISRPSAFGRLTRPGEVAGAALWFCSPASSGVTGQALVIGGEII